MYDKQCQKLGKKVWDQKEFCGGYLADFMTVSCIKRMIIFLFTNLCKLDLTALSKHFEPFSKRKSEIREAIKQ